MRQCSQLRSLSMLWRMCIALFSTPIHNIDSTLSKRMSEYKVTVLEDLSIELFYEIFEYLAPYDLLRAFENLNSRFSWILSGKELSLPNNREMSREVYDAYITSILPIRQSQIVYLHLSERRAPGAVDWFLQTGVNRLANFPLRALAIEGVSRRTFEALLSHFHRFPRLQSLYIDIGEERWYEKEYSDLPDMYYILPVIKSVRQLRTFRLLRSATRSSRSAYESSTIAVPLAYYLHTLSIEQFSHELLVKLLRYSLPQLCRLHVCFERFRRPSHPIPFPLSSVCLSKLRCVKLESFQSIRWILTLFGALYQYGQLTDFVLCTHLITFNDEDLVTAKELYQWLLRSTKCARFRLNLRDCNYEVEPDLLKDFLTDYEIIFDARCYQWESPDSFDLLVRYPKITASQNPKNKLEIIEILFDFPSHNFCVRHKDEIRLDFDGPASQLQVAQFALNNALPLLTTAVKRVTPFRIRKLLIYSNIATWISSLIIATRGSSTKLFCDTHIETVLLDRIDTSIVEIAHRVVALFGGIKKLTLSITDIPGLTLDDFQVVVQQLFQGLPTLVYLSCITYGQSTQAVDLRDISSWIRTGGINRPVSFRCHKNILDLWF